MLYLKRLFKNIEFLHTQRAVANKLFLYELFQTENKQPPAAESKKEPTDVESDGDYEEIHNEKDEDYAEVTNETSTMAHATPVLVLGADDGAEYAEAEVCRSIEWEGLVGRQVHRTVISMLEPQVVVIEDDAPIRQRPHSADELDALLCAEKDETAEGLFRAVPCRLQRAKQAAQAWAQQLPDLVIPSSKQTDEEDTKDQEDEPLSQNGVEEDSEEVYIWNHFHPYNVEVLTDNNEEVLALLSWNFF